MRTISWRNRTASVTASSTSHCPCGPSIIAVATSSEAIIGYSGDVVPCIISASLNRSCSTGARGAGRTCTMAPCDSAASSLWVDWVAKTVGRSGPGKASSSTDMP
jgi:hypothetical protein